MKLKELQASTEEVNSHLRAKNEQLEAEVDRLRERLGGQRELAQLVAAAVKAIPPYPRQPIKTTAEKGSKAVVPVFLASDWHIGEVIRADETEGFGEYNFTIAEKRLTKLAESEVRWATKQRNAYQIDEAVVIGIGDYISGSIHRELEVTNEFTLPQQAARAGKLLAKYLSELAPHFKKLTVYEVGADNHSRLQPKPQAKQKYANSMSFLVHTIANAAVRDIENIKIVEAPGMQYLATIANHRVLIEHGDNIKGQLGIPYYGFSRKAGREAKRRMNTDLGYHLHVMGHWHVPALIDGVDIVNGSLSGCSEFDHSQARFAPPSQVAFMMHPSHGFFNLTPFGV